MQIKTIYYKVFPYFLYVFGMYYFCLRILGLDLSYIPGDLGDSRLINYFLEHGHRWLSGSNKFFWSADFMYPFKNTIAISDNMLGTMPIYSFWRLLGFSFETSYQLWWLSICSLNFWCCYVVSKKWGFNITTASIMAWLFAFSIFNLGQLNYMQTIIRFCVPLAFYFGHKSITAYSLKNLILYLLCIVLQMYSVMYTGFYLFYFSLLYVLIYCFINKSIKQTMTFYFKMNLYKTLLVLFGFTVLLFVLIWPYYEMSKIIGLRLFKEVVPNLPVWQSFLFPSDSSITWHIFSSWFKPNIENWWLHTLFIGLVPLLVLCTSPIYLLIKGLKKQTVSITLKTFIITSIILALLHLRTENGLSLYALIFKLPGINSIRVPIRFMHVELFLLLFVLGKFMNNISQKFVIIFCIIFFIDNCFNPEILPRTKKAELVERKDKLLKTISSENIKNYESIALLDTVNASYSTHLDAMLVSQYLNKPCINGYSSYCHDNFGEMFIKCNKSGLIKWLNYNHIDSKKVLIIDLNNSMKE